MCHHEREYHFKSLFRCTAVADLLCVAAHHLNVTIQIKNESCFLGRQA